MNKPTSSATYGHQDTQPWYKNYMVIIFVIGLPMFVVVSCLWFVWYSIQIEDSVVRDDWYMDGKTLYQDVSRDKLAHDLGLHGEMTFSNDGGKEVTFSLIYPKQSLESGTLQDGTPIYYPDELTLSISHATDINKDHDAILHHQQGNKYIAHIDSIDPLTSKYYVQVSNEGKLNWRLREVGQLPQSRITFAPLTSFD